MAETIDLSFTADISAVKKTLKELPKATAKEASAAIKELSKHIGTLEAVAKKEERALKRARKEAFKLKKEAQDVGKRGKAGFEALKQAATGAGGAIGAAGGQVEAFGRSIMEAGTAFGPMGAAAGVAALSIGVMGAAGLITAKAIVGLVRNAGEWLDVLIEADALGGLIADEDIVALQDANLAMDGFGVAAKRVGVVLAAEYSPAVETAALLSIKFLTLIEDMVPALIEGMVPALFSMVPALSALQQPIRLLLAATGQTDVVARGLEKVNTFLKDDEGVKTAIDGAKKLAEATDESTKASRKHAEALDDEGRILDQISRALERGYKAERARAAEFFASIKVLADEEIAAEEAVAAAQRRADDDRARRLEAYRRQVEDVARASIGNITNFLDVTSEASATKAEELSDLATRLHKSGEHAAAKATEDRAEKARRAALRGYKASQTIARAEALADAAVAAVALMPFYAFLGPGAPVAAATTAGLGLASALASISQIPAPTFAGGGVVGRAFGSGAAPDHVTIQADPREGIVSPRGMAGLGADGLDAINRGGSVGQPMSITLALDGQTLAAAILSPSVKRQIVAELRAVTGAGRGTTYGRG